MPLNIFFLIQLVKQTDKNKLTLTILVLNNVIIKRDSEKS